MKANAAEIIFCASRLTVDWNEVAGVRVEVRRLLHPGTIEHHKWLTRTIEYADGDFLVAGVAVAPAAAGGCH